LYYENTYSKTNPMIFIWYQNIDIFYKNNTEFEIVWLDTKHGLNTIK